MRLIITILLMAIASLALSDDLGQVAGDPASEHPSNQSQNQASNAERESKTPVPRGARLGGVTKDAHADERSTNTHEQESTRDPSMEANRISRLDLEQQARMADSTESMGNDSRIQVAYSYWGLWLNGGGLVILAVALYYNIRATNATRDAANAALEQSRQNRAYMIFDPTSIRCQRAGGGIMFSQKWVNCGASPALDVRAEYNVVRVNPGEAPPEEIDRGIAATSPEPLKYGMVAPGQGYDGTPLLFDRKDFDGEPVHIVFYSECTYRDVHGNSYRNQFNAFALIVGTGEEAEVRVQMNLGPNNGEIELSDEEQRNKQHSHQDQDSQQTNHFSLAMRTKER